MAVHQPGVWGIDLGQCALKAIRVEEIDGEITATAFDYIEHPKILSQPDADPDQLTREALDKFLSRNTLRGDIVVISVPGQSGLARFVKLPPVEEKKISDIVRFEAKQQIPFPLDEVVWDFQKLSAGVVTDGFALETEIGLFAMKRDMVNRYLQHFQDVHVEVQVVQMAPLALCNFVTHDLLAKVTDKTEGAEEEEDDDSGKKQCIVALDIGADNSNLVITDGAKIIWQRPIPIGGNHFTRALTKDLKLTFAKAEHLKRNAVKSPDLKKILGALRPVLNDFVSEVQRSLGYFTNTHRDAHVKYMVGLGNAFRLPGLQKFVQEKLQLEVKKLQGFKRLHGESVTTAPQFTENVLSFAVAHGLALQGLKQARLQTNLLPQEIRFERVIRAKKPWAVAAAGILLLGLGLLALGRWRQHAAWDNPRIKDALALGKKYKAEATGFATQYDAALGEAKAAQLAVLRIAAGVEERFNWSQLYKYLNDSLPRPDGTRLARITDKTRTRSGVDAYQEYFLKATKDSDALVKSGSDAFQKARERQQAVASSQETALPTEADVKLEEEIKKRRVQLNVEGITSMYTDDVPAMFAALKKAGHPFLGLTKGEKEEVAAPGEKFPKKAWVIEIRGYTYHEAGGRFVVNTLVENLMNPKAAGYTPGEPIKSHIQDRLRYAFLYKAEEDTNPQGGTFKLINTSHLRTVLGGGLALGKPGETNKGMPANMQPSPSGQIDKGDDKGDGKPATASRDGWRPIGEMASQSLASAPTAGPGGFGGYGNMRPQQPPLGVTPNPEVGTGQGTPPARLPRTEFVVFFIWSEPLPAEGSAEAPPNPPA